MWLTSVGLLVCVLGVGIRGNRGNVVGIRATGYFTNKPETTYHLNPPKTPKIIHTIHIDPCDKFAAGYTTLSILNSLDLYDGTTL